MDTRKKGEQWKAWGSRLIRVTPGTGMQSSGHLYVLSCYAPTFAASRDVREAFFDNLQHALIGIAATRRVVAIRIIVMLGDFNACVRSRSGESDLWDDVRGTFGLGEVNNVGKNS